MKKLAILSLLAMFSGLCHAVNESGTGQQQEFIETITGIMNWLAGWLPF